MSRQTKPTLDLGVVENGDICYQGEEIAISVSKFLPDATARPEEVTVTDEKGYRESQLVEDCKGLLKSSCLARTELKEQPTVRQGQLRPTLAVQRELANGISIGGDLQSKVLGIFQDSVPSTTSVRYPSETLVGDEFQEALDGRTAEVGLVNTVEPTDLLPYGRDDLLDNGELLGRGVRVGLAAKPILCSGRVRSLGAAVGDVLGNGHCGRQGFARLVGF